MTASFDLVDEPWVPVSSRGELTAVSLHDALVRAHEFDGLAASPATVNVAVLRQVLLPALLDALGAPRNRAAWADRHRSGSFERDAVSLYLDRHRDRFDLFSPTAPFAQVAALRSGGEAKTAAVLIPSIASGNNAPIFSTFTDDHPPTLTSAEAVLWLLHAHCFDTAAIKSGALDDPSVKAGKTTGNPTGPVGAFGAVVPTGPTLFDTLLLNTPVLPDGLAPADMPSWRRPPGGPGWREGIAAGPLELLTWQSRRIRLVPSESEDAVRRVVLTAGDRLAATPDFEPHALWKIGDAKAGALRRPARHRFGRSAWQGLPGLLALPAAPSGGDIQTSLLLAQAAALLAEGHLAEDFPLGVETAGVRYGNQSAVIEDIASDAIPLPLTALRVNDELGELVESLASDADALVRALDVLEGQLRRAAGSEPIPWDAGQRASAALVPLLDPTVRRLLSGLRAEPHRVGEARTAWHRLARRHVMRVADEVLLSAAPRTVVGREVGGKRVASASNIEQRFRRAVNDVVPPVKHQGVA